MVINREKSGGIDRELDSILEPVGSLEVIPSLALEGGLNHHLDLDTECGSLEADEQETNLDQVRDEGLDRPGLDGKMSGEKNLASFLDS